MEEMLQAYTTLGGRAVPVAVYRQALLNAPSAGVVWDTGAWRLLADAEKRGEVVWDVKPGWPTE